MVRTAAIVGADSSYIDAILKDLLMGYYAKHFDIGDSIFTFDNYTDWNSGDISNIQQTGNRAIFKVERSVSSMDEIGYVNDSGSGIPLIVDADNRTYVTAIHKVVKYKMSVSYRDMSRVRIETLSRAINKDIQYSRISVGVATGRYSIPNEAMGLLNEIHEIMALNLPETDLPTVEDYISSVITPNVGLTSNNNIVTTQGITKLIGIQIINQSDKIYRVPKPNKEGISELQHMFEITLRVPDYIELKHPMSVYNMVLGPDHLPTVDVPEVSSNIVYRTAMDFGIELSNEAGDIGSHKCIIMPEFDQFTPSVNRSNASQLLSTYCTIEFDSRKELLSIYDIGDIEIHPKLIEYLKETNLTDCLRPYGDIVFFEVYGDDALLDGDGFEIDRDTGTLSSKEDLDIKMEYRVVMYVINTQYQLHPSKIRQMLTSGKLAAVTEILGIKYGDRLSLKKTLPRLEIGENNMFNIMVSSTSLHRDKIRSR